MLINEEKNNDDLVKRVCISPTLKTFAETDMFLTFVRSHEWIVDRAEEFGKDGILNKIHCRHCGLERMAILSQIKESETRASDYRRKVAQH